MRTLEATDFDTGKKVTLKQWQCDDFNIEKEITNTIRKKCKYLGLKGLNMEVNKNGSLKPSLGCG